MVAGKQGVDLLGVHPGRGGKKARLSGWLRRKTGGLQSLLGLEKQEEGEVKESQKRSLRAKRNERREGAIAPPQRSPRRRAKLKRVDHKKKKVKSKCGTRLEGS